jgi:hypothetical protein
LQAAFFVAFAPDGDGLGAQVNIADAGGAEFGCADAGIEQGVDDGAVAVGAGECVGGVAVGS